MKTWTTRVGIALVALLAAISLPDEIRAQGVTTSAISGTVTDDTGAPLPGANVVATHVPTGTQYGTTSDVNGAYNLVTLRPGGPYTVQFSFVGFRTVAETGINLRLGETRVLNVELQEAAAELGEVEVVGIASTVLNSERTGASTNISQETIERLPTIQRSLSDFARLAPQSTGGNSLAGRNNRYNNIQIDGATLNDVFGLSGTGAPGGQAGAQPIGLDAIQEFNVDIAPYDIRYNGFTGGAINAITRSGTNRFEGSVYFLGRNEHFVGALEPQPGDVLNYPEFSESFAGFRLGGPILQNKLFFFVNAELRRRNDPLATGLLGSGAANVFEVEPSTVNEIIDIARDQYGYDPGGYDLLTQDQGNHNLFARLDWNIDQRNRLTLRHNFVSANDDDGISRGTRRFDLANRQYIFRSDQNSTVAQLNTTFGSNAFNEARLVYTRIRDQRDVEADPFPEVRIDVGGGREVVLGIDRFSQANALDQDLVEFTDNLTYLRGKHSFLFGTSNQIWRFNNLFIQDYYGSYQFDSVEDFRLGRPALYQFSYAADGFGEQPRAAFTAFQLGFYAQDEYSVNPNLQFTVGLRLDVPVFPQEPPTNPAAVEAFGVPTTNTGSGNLLWSPRLGFNYAFSSERNTQLRGGTGIFSGRTPYVWISNQFSNTGVDVLRTRAFNLPAGFFVPEADPSAQPRPGTSDLLEPIQTAEINLIDNDFKFPQVWRTNLAVDQRLPYGFVGTLEGLYTKTLNDVVYQNLNLVQTGTSANGRPIYGEIKGFRGVPSRLDPRFTNALYLSNTDEGHEYSLTAQLQKSTSRGLNGTFSYTFNRAENVNSATSSRAISNWQFNENFDVNNPRLSTSDFEVRHRLLGVVSQRFDWLERFATTVSLVYEGRSGSPFSWIYVGDANADGQSFNDLVYVPASADEVVIQEGSWEELDRFIGAFESLEEARGTVVERNAGRVPWRNLLDLQLTQTIETVPGQRVEFTANLFNVLNFLNGEWGRVQFLQFDNVSIWDFEGYTDDGRPIIAFEPGRLAGYAEDRESLYLTSDLASRWQLQLGLRYTF